MDLIEQILETWRINARVTSRLLETIPASWLTYAPFSHGARTIGREFSHIHYVRLSQIRKRVRGIASGVQVFPSDEEPQRTQLVAALAESARRVERWLRAGCTGSRPVRTFNRGVVPTLGHLIAHESHHRGRILLVLKLNGESLDAVTRYGMWDWDRI